MIPTRREFLGIAGAAAGMSLLPPLPLALPAPLKLYSVAEWDYDPVLFEGCEGWCDAVWARSEAEAIEWARENYGGECYGEVPEINVLSVWSGESADMVAVSSGHRETRPAVLRQAGWQEEGDQRCECCDLAEYGDWPVCQTCYCCPECREPDCEKCRP